MAEGSLYVHATGNEAIKGVKDFATAPTVNGVPVSTGANSTSSTIVSSAVTSYTLQASDNGKTLEFTSSSAITMTCPNSMTQGFNVALLQAGAGAIQVVAASGATIHNWQANAQTAGQWARAVLLVRANSDGTHADYVFYGDTTTLVALAPTGFGVLPAPWGSPVFDEDFNTPAAEGMFLQTYTNMDAYPTDFYMTNQSGPNGDHYGGNGNLSATGGAMRMRMYRDASTGQCVGATPIPLLPSSVYQTYGRYVIRFRLLENTAGWKIAWLLWPLEDDNGTKPWPASGEFDFIEGSLNANMEAYHHWYNGTSGGDQDSWFSNVAFGTGWHTVIAEWTPSYVRTVIDGVEIGRRDSSTSPGGTSKIVPTPMRAALQSEVNIGGPYPGSAPATQRIDVDRIAVYAYAP
jgi:hypothetical protein